jgi:uncharacterized protein with PIN domain
MAVKVIDASSLVAIMFDEPEAERIAPELESATLVAPTLLWFEIVNACLTKLRRHPDRRVGILQAFVLQGGRRSKWPRSIMRACSLWPSDSS